VQNRKTILVKKKNSLFKKKKEWKRDVPLIYFLPMTMILIQRFHHHLKMI